MTGLSNASGLTATSSSLILRASNSGLAYVGSAPSQAETALWQAAVIANGGIASPAQLTLVSNFISAEKSAGTWDLSDDYWPLWTENATQALTSLKQLRLAVAVALPVFTVNRGYTFDGATQFLNTGFIPSSHAVAMTGNNMRLAAYERVNVSNNTHASGSYMSDTQCLYVVPNNGGVAGGGANSTFFSKAVPTSLGLTVINRLNTSFLVYKNGVALDVPVTGSAGAVLPTFALYIGGTNNNGTLGFARVGDVGMIIIGAALTPAQELAQYTNVQAWATAIGANV